MRYVCRGENEVTTLLSVAEERTCHYAALVCVCVYVCVRVCVCVYACVRMRGGLRSMALVTY